MKYLLVFLLLLVPQLSMAGIESREFANPEQQADYDSLTSELRCLVCQNQTIADSNAELAGDLRRQVYEMLQQGKSREDIVQFMTDHYGDFVLYNPPFKAKTGLLWLGPVLFLIVGLIAVYLIVRRKKNAAAALAGSDREQAEKLAEIRRLLDTGDRS